VLLGHSWDALLALEYALRNPSRVSRLILMNPAPVSASQLGVLRKSYVGQLGNEMQRQQEITTSPAYQAGDPEAVAARYRDKTDYDLLPKMRSLQIPTLVIVGSREQRSPPSRSADISPI
jgi:pimeloyl-ACP methyl ester carboxylesterase